MKKFLFILMMLPMVGCSTYSNSTYKDNSTADRRDIEATGAAAVEAAKSNTDKNVDIKGLQVSHNTHHQADVTMTTGKHRYVVFGPDGKRDHRAELRLMQQSMHNRNGRQSVGEYTQNRLDREWDHRVKRKIDAEIDRFMDKIF